MTNSLTKTKESPSSFVRGAWRRLQPLPGGKWAFTRMMGFFGPYAGSISPAVEELRHSYARVRMPYRRAIKNHIGCVHAAALFNLAEFTVIMALSHTVPDEARFIVAGAQIDYVSKARSEITGICECPPIDGRERREYEVPVCLQDAQGNTVAEGRIRVLVGPNRTRK
jgi:uncharacterized protein (TIGR00369 family)